MDSIVIISDLLDNQNLDVSNISYITQMAQDYEHQILFDEINFNFKSLKREVRSVC